MICYVYDTFIYFLKRSRHRYRLLPSTTSEAVLVKVLALIDIVLDTVGDWLAAEEALWRVIRVASLALKRAVWLRVEALSRQRLIAKVANEARIVVVDVVMQRHLLATVETSSAFFAFDIQWVHHF